MFNQLKIFDNLFLEEDEIGTIVKPNSFYYPKNDFYSLIHFIFDDTWNTLENLITKHV